MTSYLKTQESIKPLILFGVLQISDTDCVLFCAFFLKKKVVFQKTNYSLFLVASLLPERTEKSNINI